MLQHSMDVADPQHVAVHFSVDAGPYLGTARQHGSGRNRLTCNSRQEPAVTTPAVMLHSNSSSYASAQHQLPGGLHADTWMVLFSPTWVCILRLLQSIEGLAAEVEDMRRQPSPLAAAQAAKQEVLADQRKFQEVIAGNQVRRHLLTQAQAVDAKW